MIKNILVHLSVSGPKDVARDYAISVAELFEAHLSGVAFGRDFPAWLAGDGMASATLIQEWSAGQQAEAANAVKQFDESVRLRTFGADSRVVSDRFGEPAKLFGELARSYDLVVMPQSRSEGDTRNDLFIEAALFESGRPVLMVPFIQADGMKLDRVMVCWDGSRNAARAVGDALPLLKRARKVEVITVEDKDRPQDLRGAKIAESLARHKLDVDLKSVVAPDIEAESIILNEVAEAGVDLVVMGAYGNSRFREFVLGGVTRGMLKAMTAPVLMSH